MPGSENCNLPLVKGKLVIDAGDITAANDFAGDEFSGAGAAMQPRLFKINRPTLEK